MKARFSIRTRIALAMTSLVAVSGVVLIFATVTLTDRWLRDRNRPAAPGLAAPGTVPLQVQRGAAVAASTLHDVRSIGLLLTLAFAFVALIAGWFIAGRITRPLRQLRNTVKTISAGELERRIPIEGPRDELRDLAVAFDEMLERLAEAFESQRRFVADASHELRTPLALMRTEVDVALDDDHADVAGLRDALAAVRDAIDRSNQLVDSLLVLSRSENVRGAELVDLAELADGARIGVARLGLGARRFATSLEPSPVRGDPALLERAVANLVENAVRYNRDGGSVSISCCREGEHVNLVVENDGPVLRPDEVAPLFGRFRRRMDGRSRATGGFGLGLAIVESVVRVHGGSVDAEARPAGGLRVTVSLPAAAARRSEYAAPDALAPSSAVP